MKNKYLPSLYGVVKDYHPRMIPENKVADCLNVMFAQGRVKRRYGFASLGTDHLNGVINGIAFYEQVRLGDKYTLVFTSRDAYLYNTTNGSFTPISLTYNTGTARCNALAVTGAGTTWLPASWTLDTYQMKFGTNNSATTAINFTGTVGNWTAVAAAEANEWRSVAYGNGVWIAIANTGTNRVMRSTDGGVSWSAVAAAEANNWLSVAYGNGVWVAVSYNGTNRVMRSTNDGVSWAAVAAAEANEWYSVAYGNGVWVAVSSTGTNRVMRSTNDGVSWSAVAAAEANNWMSVAYGNGVWVAVSYNGTNRVMRFTDTTISSVTTTNLYVGLLLTATFLQVGTRIRSIDWAGSTITIDRPASGSATAGAISADISAWYNILSVDSGTGITLDPISTFTGNTHTSTTIDGITDTSILHVGMGISGSGIAANTYITEIVSSTSITINNAATATASGVTISIGLVITSGHEVNYVLKLCFNGGDDDYWSFAYPYLTSVGDKIICATNGIDPIMKWDGTGEMEVLGGTPPTTAKYIGYFGAAMYEHFIAAWTTDTGSNLPQTIELADAGTPETWSGTYYDLLQKNDEIVGIEILKSRLVIYKTKSISMAYPTPEGGNDDPLDIEQDLIIDIEIPVGKTVVNFGDYHLFLGLDNVYRFNGIGLEPIGTEVINTMKNEWNGSYMHRAFAFAIPNENLYCIFIPTLATYDSAGNMTKAEATYPDKAYCYNYAEGTWTIWTFGFTSGIIPRTFSCAGFANKVYAPTVAEIDALNQTYADMEMRWTDLISYSTIQSLLLGDPDGWVYEFRDVYGDDNGVAISASFTTRDYELNDPKHVFMLLESVIGMTRKLTGQIQIRASVDFGNTWSAWIPVTQNGGAAYIASYVEYIANFMHKGLQVRFEIANLLGADFEIESIMIGFNDEMGHKK